MYEVELKLRADHESLRDRLTDAGATKTGEYRQTDTYYNAPHREFADTDEALRIRREVPADGSEEAKLTYKGPLIEAESKTREEHETRVVDDDAAAGILAGLGFEPAATVDKNREYYDLDGYTIVLDDVTDLGTFVEIERETTEDEVEHVREKAIELLGRLGLDADDQIRTSYLGLLLAQAEE
ncbi:class IV adenylate cyclase [Halonotius terrestris]|uniref:Class IV adenylate cyclase n=1 Tax=Halonotius terrestris TaxID=2487750 RepID=A0A8J8PA86_9EURY|nr:class IV adenylate cyclase [Halonotius terrestris]TQQ79222.1 class IV adenylate cyclase [Halonotius terrestris]